LRANGQAPGRPG